MSPAIAGRFPWYPRLFRGRQTARSLHFLFLVAFLLFILIHVTLVILVHAGDNFGNMVFGHSDYYEGLAIGIAAFALVLVVIGHVAITRWSIHAPRAVQRTTGAVNDLIVSLFLSPLQSRQAYRKNQISPYFWLNGVPPTVNEWLTLAQGSFINYALEVHGLVEQPLRLTLADLHAFPATSQITEHVCIQGWSGIAEWAGVPLHEILQRCKPLPQARYIIFHSYQTDSEGREYYESFPLEEADYPQTILAYDMNGQPLPVNHGAPLRLRMETKLGFKMVKWLKSIELVENYLAIGEGQGGYREDVQYYSPGAQI
jgi:DMSO/TMAO reductase YedYZ molybdopterin-dependent catalytic subunit